MITIGLLRHVWHALRRAFARMLLWFLVVGAIAVVVAELVGILATGGQLPTLLTHLTALALGLAVGYAAAMTVLVTEMFHDLTTTVRDLEHDIEHGMEASGTLLRHGAQVGASQLQHAAAGLERRKAQP